MTGGWQVRQTELENGQLIVRPDDSDDAPFAMVVGKIPTFRIVGWIRGRAAKKGFRLRAPNNRPAAYFVAQESLWPLTMIKHPSDPADPSRATDPSYDPRC